MPKPYCGIGDIPKGHRRGSMKECAEKKQVRYYGIKKIDVKLAESYQNKPKMNLQKVMDKIASLRGKRTRIEKLIKGEKDKKVKEKLKQDFAKATKELKEQLVLYKANKKD